MSGRIDKHKRNQACRLPNGFFPPPCVTFLVVLLLRFPIQDVSRVVYPCNECQSHHSSCGNHRERIRKWRDAVYSLLAAEIKPCHSIPSTWEFLSPSCSCKLDHRHSHYSWCADDFICLHFFWRHPAIAYKQDNLWIPQQIEDYLWNATVEEIPLHFKKSSFNLKPNLQLIAQDWLGQ